MKIRIGRRGKSQRQKDKEEKAFQNSAENRQFNELRGMAVQLGVNPAQIGNFQRGNKQNNAILEQLRSQVNTASLAKAPQRPTVTFGDAAPMASRQPQYPMSAQGAPSFQSADGRMATKDGNPAAAAQGLSLQQFQQQANPAQPRPAMPTAPQPQQQPSAQGFQPIQPQGAQQNNTSQRFQQLRNQFTQQAPQQPQQQAPQQQPPKPAQPAQQQAQQQPASQQTQQPAQQQPNPTEEEKKRLGQM